MNKRGANVYKALYSKDKIPRYLCEKHGKYLRTKRTGDQCPLCVIGKETVSPETLVKFEL